MLQRRCAGLGCSYWLARSVDARRCNRSARIKIGASLGQRAKQQLVREKSSHILRIQKTLEDANIKPDSVITDIMGLSGRKMIEALIPAVAWSRGRAAPHAMSPVKPSPDDQPAGPTWQDPSQSSERSQRWLRLFEQNFHVVKWAPAGVRHSAGQPKLTSAARIMLPRRGAATRSRLDRGCTPRS